jgi:hypothetical protein
MKSEASYNSIRLRTLIIFPSILFNSQHPVKLLLWLHLLHHNLIFHNPQTLPIPLKHVSISVHPQPTPEHPRPHPVLHYLITLIRSQITQQPPTLPQPTPYLSDHHPLLLLRQVKNGVEGYYRVETVWFESEGHHICMD